MDKIGIIVTTFLRDDLLYKTIQTIINNLPDNCIILIGDQNPTEAKLHTFSQEKVYYYGLPFDYGLSASRNFLVQEAQKLKCNYILLSADSIEFTKKYDFESIISFLESNKDYGLIGLSDDSIPWNVNMELIPKKHWQLDISHTEKIIYNNIEFLPCDMCGNFFLAKIECLLENKWNNDLKLAEHEAFFWELKKLNKWKVFYTDYIVSKHIIAHNESQYNSYRQRIYTEFRKKLQEIYNITGWVTYTPDLIKVFNNYKRTHKCR